MVKKLLVNGMVLATLIIGWASLAGAWTFTVDTYSHVGTEQLRGTVPGATYWARGGNTTNDSAAPAELSVDLYYGNFNGQWQWSPDHGVTWFSIDPSITNWTQTVNSGDSVSLRVVLLDANDVIYHILSTSPYGIADESLGDAYYFAFSPNAYYYNDFSTGEVGISGYVAVILN